MFVRRWYERTSDSCAFDELDAWLQVALGEVAESLQLGGLASGAVARCQTRSVPIRRKGLRARPTGGSGPDGEALAGAVLTPTHLVVAATSAWDGPVEIGDLELEAISSSPLLLG